MKDKKKVKIEQYMEEEIYQVKQVKTKWRKLILEVYEKKFRKKLKYDIS